MHYYLLYKDDSVIGWKASTNPSNIPNAREVTEEEYLESGGPAPMQDIEPENTESADIEVLLDAILQ